MDAEQKKKKSVVCQQSFCICLSAFYGGCSLFFSLIILENFFQL